MGANQERYPLCYAAPILYPTRSFYHKNFHWCSLGFEPTTLRRLSHTAEACSTPQRLQWIEWMEWMSVKFSKKSSLSDFFCFESNFFLSEKNIWASDFNENKTRREFQPKRKLGFCRKKNSFVCCRGGASLGSPLRARAPKVRLAVNKPWKPTRAMLSLDLD